jgi:hypothetical protein
MSDDVDRVVAEIDRLALQTTDPMPMQLFVERAKLQKRQKMWKLGGGAFGILTGSVAFVALFANNDYGVPEAGAVAVVVFFLIAVIGRGDINAKTENWLVRARQVVSK